MLTEGQFHTSVLLMEVEKFAYALALRHSKNKKMSTEHRTDNSLRWGAVDSYFESLCGFCCEHSMRNLAKLEYKFHECRSKLNQCYSNSSQTGKNLTRRNCSERQWLLCRCQSYLSIHHWFRQTTNMDTEMPCNKSMDDYIKNTHRCQSPILLHRCAWCSQVAHVMFHLNVCYLCRILLHVYRESTLPCYIVNKTRRIYNMCMCKTQLQKA